MINSKNDLKEYLNIERKKYDNVHMSWMLFPVGEQDYIWRYQWILRHVEYHKNTNHKIRYVFFNIWHKRLSTKLGIHIPQNVCGRGLKIKNVWPILINGKAKLGENVSLHINTSIVAHGNNGGVPYIGNGVELGVGSVVLGNVKIANNIAIGANAVVNKSFDEEDIAIAGVPAKKISNKGRTAWAERNNNV